MFFSRYVSFFEIEIVADNQQFKFQTNEYRWLAIKKNNTVNKDDYTDEEIADFKRGFLTRGLFKYSRQPNFYGKLGMWYVLASFTLSSQINEQVAYSNLLPFNYGFNGIYFLNALFHKSTELTERISTEKYEDYKFYKNKVRRIIIGWPNEIDINKDLI